TDEYGGSFENRIRFTLEVVREVKQQAGDDFLVGIHYFMNELMQGGWGIAEAVKLAPILEKEGIDFMIPSVSTFESVKEEQNQGLLNRKNFLLEETIQLREAVDIPIIAN